REHLLLAARQRGAVLAPALVQAGKAAIVTRERWGVGGAATPRHLHETQGQVFLDREPGEDPAILRHEADAETADAVGGRAVDPHSVESDLAAAGADPAGDGLEQRGLADAIAAEYTQHFARPHRQADALHDVAGAVMSVQVRDVEHRQACPK